jgi:nucleoside-diphosphate-sugar epimerase
MSNNTALVVGSTGIVGSALANHLFSQNWKVYGLARKPRPSTEILPVAADLLDPASLTNALKNIKPTHIFFNSWLRQPTEAENIKVNSAMVRNLLDVTSKFNTVEHVGLVTGLKHYLGPFESYGKGKMPPTPFRESQGRLDVENFYYAQEDEVFAAAKRDGFGWSVQRPHTIIGYALGNAMNMGVTLAVYASICRETGRPFIFPGSAAQWNGLTDMTDANLLARHQHWAAITPTARDQAFNVVNGDIFRWSWMWERLAAWFGVEPAPFPDTTTPLESQLANAAPLWHDLATRHNLAETKIEALVSAWHTDADLGRPLEVITDMSKSRKLGFTDYQATDDSFFALFERLRADRIIP